MVREGVRVSVKGERFVKAGSKVRLQEAYNLEYVQGKVACPKLYRYYQQGDEVVIEMEYVPGETLRAIWPTLDNDQKQCVVDNITNEIRKLRAFGSGDTSTCGINNTIVHSEWFGEFNLKDEQELNKRVASTVQFNPKVQALVQRLLPTSSRFCLGHGNLYDVNIIVKEDMSIVFVGWECMGFFPEYWDPMMLFILSRRDKKMIDQATSNMNVDNSILAAFHIILVIMFK
ncbi:hypothetical protein LPJ61_001883 [Coemansia biformis]|uniref:Aminoglycoside phosphotransferase domain-containing protein n=1 Tax=Coemansia biformis TaxID=1286918 RepID=A0A9W7YE34_9FUNG|nr:hypothetical protein LPJ61_001883 [Coemansia biformis]